MDVLISGTAGRAVFVGTTEAYFVNVDEPDRTFPISREQASRILADATDVELVTRMDVSKAIALAEERWRVDRCLRMIQMLLSPETDCELSGEAATHLSDLFGADIGEQVRFHASAIPFPGSIEKALRFAKGEIVCDLFNELHSLQDAIITVKNSWDALPEDLFESERSRLSAEILAVRKGCFYRLASSTTSGKVNDALLFVLKDLASLSNYREIARLWLKPLAGIGRPTFGKLKIVADRSPERHWAPPERLHARSPAGEYESVEREKLGVIEQLRRGDPERAAAFAEQLIQRQLRQPQKEFAVKSLCSLASEAKQLFYHDLQLAWLEWAVRIEPADAWAHGQLADVYFSRNRFHDAHVSYSKARDLGERRFGATGVARVLGVVGRISDALQICDELLATLPDTEVDVYRTWALRAELFRDRWEFSEALKTYEHAISLFPDQAALYCGRAAVLTDMGELRMALSSYEAAVTRFPNEVVPRCGYADVLKNLGELDKSVTFYHATSEQFPSESVPLAGEASVLIEMGRYDEAASICSRGRSQFPFDEAFFQLEADILRETGDRHGAVLSLEAATGKIPTSVRLRSALGGALRSIGRFADALQVLERNVHDFPYHMPSLLARASLLKVLGDLDAALGAYQGVLAKRPDYLHAIVAIASIYVLKSDYKRANQILPSVYPGTKSEWIALHVSGMISYKKGCFREAADIFAYGAKNSPFYDVRSNFNSALAGVLIAWRKYRAAARIATKAFGSVALLIQAHSEALTGHAARARQSLMAVNDNEAPGVIRVRDLILTALHKGRLSNPKVNASLVKAEMDLILEAA